MRHALVRRLSAKRRIHNAERNASFRRGACGDLVRRGPKFGPNETRSELAGSDYAGTLWPEYEPEYERDASFTGEAEVVGYYGHEL